MYKYLLKKEKVARQMVLKQKRFGPIAPPAPPTAAVTGGAELLAILGITQRQTKTPPSLTLSGVFESKQYL